MLHRDLVLNIARLGLAALAVVAMTYQFATTGSAGNFFSFFTIQSNILAAAMLALTAIVPRPSRTLLFDAARGAVTLYIAITGTRTPSWTSASSATAGSCSAAPRCWLASSPQRSRSS